MQRDLEQGRTQERHKERVPKTIWRMGKKERRDLRQFGTWERKRGAT